MIALATSLLLAAAVPKVYDEHPKKVDDVHAAAWFLEDPRKGVWCAFTSRKALDAMGKQLGDANLEETPAFAWLVLDHGAVSSITIETMSEDAFTDDRYQFDGSGRVTEMARTGHYINDAWTTFYYRPDAKGHVALPREGRQAAARLAQTKQFTTYWLEWDRYDRLSQMPFAALIAVDPAGKVTVTPRCTTAPKTPNKRHSKP